ncbi:MAG: hypothetical protein ACYS9T_00390 [Planctomycetota bacterium]|jgi:hypothetical protein
MCKKLMFLISFVLLISWGAIASAANLEVSCGNTHTVSGTENYDEWQIEGVVIVPEGATLTASERSEIDGEFPCGTMIVDGGTATVDNRMDLGKGDGATLIIQNGGSFTQTGDSDGIKAPDDGGGEIRIRVGPGTLTAVAMEVIGLCSLEAGDSDRDARVEVCWDATINVCDIYHSKPERYDPRSWLECGDLYPICGVTEDDIIIAIDGDCATVTTPPPCDPLKASKPTPADGEKGIASVETDVILCWKAACGIGTLGRHYLFFGTDDYCIYNAPSYSIGWIAPDCYVGPPLLAGTTCKNMGNFPLWTTQYWRIDEKLQTGEMIKGDVWRFTTGCDPVPAGDVNLDCLVNLDDWALMLTTWGEEQFFPWD